MPEIERIVRQIYRGTNVSLLVLNQDLVEWGGLALQTNGEYKEVSDLLEEPHVIISILDPGYEAQLPENESRKAVLRLGFHDIEGRLAGCTLMDRDQAKEIADFVYEWKDRVSLIVIHCHMGYSRSAGTACAISNHFNRDETFFTGHYGPNSRVRTLVLEALENRRSEQE